MIPARQYVVFQLDNQQHALPIETVDRIIHAVAVTSIPGAAPPAVGVIDVQGRVMPVISGRALFGLPSRQLALGDQFIIVRQDGRRAALIVDAVTRLVDIVAQDTTDTRWDDTGLAAHIHQEDGGMILLHDIAHLLGPPQNLETDGRLAQRGAAG